MAQGAQEEPPPDTTNSEKYTINKTFYCFSRAIAAANNGQSVFVISRDAIEKLCISEGDGTTGRLLCKSEKFEKDRPPHTLVAKGPILVSCYGYILFRQDEKKTNVVKVG